MNENIVGGWKYINNQTGGFFHDMSNFRPRLSSFLAKLDTYQPRDYVLEHYGNVNAGKRLMEFVRQNFAHRVHIPNGSQTLKPVFS